MQYLEYFSDNCFMLIAILRDILRACALQILYSETVVLPDLRLGKDKSDQTRDICDRRKSPPVMSW